MRFFSNLNLFGECGLLRIDLALRTYTSQGLSRRSAQQKAVDCLTVDETADRLDVGKNTVKTQLQSIYAKTKLLSQLA